MLILLPSLLLCMLLNSIFFFLLTSTMVALTSSCSSSLDLFCPDPVTKGKDDEDGELIACVEAELVYRLLRISFCIFSLS